MLKKMFHFAEAAVIANNFRGNAKKYKDTIVKKFDSGDFDSFIKMKTSGTRPPDNYIRKRVSLSIPIYI